MANVIIDRKNRTITITKAYNAKASKYGTDEYYELSEIQNAHIGYRINVKNPTHKKLPLGKITYEQIEKYIKAHDKNDEIWNEYLKLRGKTDINEYEDENEDELEIKVTASFFEIKKWFAKKYPDLLEDAKARKKEIKEIIKNVA